MWNNKNKAVTFSFDDGVTQDKRLIEILNKKYHMQLVLQLEKRITILIQMCLKFMQI